MQLCELVVRRGCLGWNRPFTAELACGRRVWRAFPELSRRRVPEEPEAKTRLGPGAGGLGCSHLLLCSQCSESLLCRTRPSVRACVAQAQVCSGKSGLTPAPSVLFLPSSCKSSSEEAGFVSPLAPLSRVHGTCFLDAGQPGAHTLSTLCF